MWIGVSPLLVTVSRVLQLWVVIRLSGHQASVGQERKFGAEIAQSQSGT
jgi:hypothetical protein